MRDHIGKHGSRTQSRQSFMIAPSTHIRTPRIGETKSSLFIGWNGLIHITPNSSSLLTLGSVGNHLRIGQLFFGIAF